MNHDTRHEILIATVTATLLEGVAVALILATGFVWLSIYATGGQ